MFNGLNGIFASGSSKKRPLEIKKQKITIKAAPSLNAQSSKPRDAQSQRLQVKRTKKKPNISADLQIQSKQVTQQRARPPPPCVDFGSEDVDVGDSDDNGFTTTKRMKHMQSSELDPKRRLRAHEAFEKHDGVLTMRHGADMPKLDKLTKFEPIFEGLSMDFQVLLQYPSVLPKERFASWVPVVFYS